MLSLMRQFRPSRYVVPTAQLPAGFTLIEVVIALAVLGVMAAGCYLGFNSINTYAVTSRLYTEAQTAAQNQIDLVLSRDPFDSSSSGAYITGSFDPCLNKIPIELMTTAELDVLSSAATCGNGTARTPVTFPTTAPSSPPAQSSSYYPYYPYYRTATGQPISKQAFIYQDPVSGQVIVIGTLVTTVIDAGMNMTFAGATTNLNVRKATGTVNYSFRNKNYSVALDTLRTANQ
jgi:prepilin-type N-terminal cleavage/methylation domain-containing protein